MGQHVIAIDGPASSGKSTIARRLAERLGWQCLDTGAMYRAATLAALRGEVDTSDADAVAELLSGLVIKFGSGPDARRVYLNNEDVSEAVRKPEVTTGVHRLASNPVVRNWMRKAQRAFAGGHPTVAEGRDMGTVVFPDAACKIFLDADEEIRAARRQRELAARGEVIPYQEVLDRIRDRDFRDANRAVAPLAKAPDSVVIDTSNMTVDEVVRACLEAARVRGLA